MPLIVDHANSKHVRTEDRTANRGNKFSYFSFPDKKEMPHATANSHVGTRVGRTHFHVNDQFQVAMNGVFKIGRHRLTPYSIHFTRAFTPYGPLVGETDYTFMVMRAHRDPGPQYLPEKRGELMSVPHRKPWQVSAHAEFPHESICDFASGVILSPVPQIRDDYGLAAYTLVLKKNATTYAPDPSFGDGQYLVVVEGGLWHEKNYFSAPTLIFVNPQEGAYQINAGDVGLKALVLNFPMPGVSTLDRYVSI